MITRAGGRLFFDKRDGSSLDALTVAETSPEQIAEDKDNINGVQQLSAEATTLKPELLAAGGKAAPGAPEREEQVSSTCGMSLLALPACQAELAANPCCVCFLTFPLQATHIWVQGQPI